MSKVSHVKRTILMVSLYFALLGYPKVTLEELENFNVKSKLAKRSEALIFPAMMARKVWVDIRAQDLEDMKFDSNGTAVDRIAELLWARKPGLARYSSVEDLKKDILSVIDVTFTRTTMS